MLWLALQGSVHPGYVQALQQFLVSMHLRFCLGMGARTGLHQHLHQATPSQPDQVCSHVTHSDLPSNSYSLHLRTSWTAFYLSASGPSLPYTSKAITAAAQSKCEGIWTQAPLVTAQAAKPDNSFEQLASPTATATPAPSSPQQQQSPKHASMTAAQQAEAGLPRSHSSSLHLTCLSGLQALMKSNDSWAKLEVETYEAGLWTLSIAALECMMEYADSREGVVNNFPALQPQINFICKPSHCLICA